MREPSPIDWQPLAAVDDETIAAARTASHYAVQWLGRFGRAFGTPQADDSHTSLSWDSKTKALRNGTEKYELAFDFDRFALTLRQTGQSTKDFSLKNKSDADVRNWLGAGATELGLDPSSLDHDLPYELPGSPLASGKPYNDDTFKSGLAFLHDFYANAATTLESISRQTKGALPVRCWPHHFDIATLIAIDPQTSEEARSIGVGFSPGDETYSTPYLYITPWPYPSTDALTPLPSPGNWHTDGWVGGILKISDLVAVGDQKKALNEFAGTALAQSHSLLGAA